MTFASNKTAPTAQKLRGGYYTLDRVSWFNNRRLLGPIGNIPPAEAEENFNARRDVFDMVA